MKAPSSFPAFPTRRCSDAGWNGAGLLHMSCCGNTVLWVNNSLRKEKSFSRGSELIPKDCKFQTDLQKQAGFN